MRDEVSDPLAEYRRVNRDATLDLARLAAQAGVKRFVFLISDGVDVSTSDLLRKVAGACGVKSRLLPVPVGLMRFAAKALGKGAVADRLFGNLQVDSSKAQDLLGWQPVVTMDEALGQMFNS